MIARCCIMMQAGNKNQKEHMGNTQINPIYS